MPSEFGNDVLVQGYFFQHQNRIGVRAVPVHGNAVVVVNQLVGIMFAGGLSRGSDGVWIGWLNELGEGPSMLDEIDFVPDALRFLKHYENDRDGDRIEYTFHLRNGFWVGTWSGSNDRGHYGDGHAVCVLTPVPPAFFEPPND